MTMLKRTFVVILTILICSHSSGNPYNPVADGRAVVVTGNARFTVLTPRLIRMEWAADGHFEDRATLGIVNRRTEVPAFKVRRSAGKTIITTESLRLTYTGTEKFRADNLKVEFTMKDPSARKGEKKVVWCPGTDDSGNLLGTTRTLDGFDGTRTREPYDPGVVSRDGWAIIDESRRPVLIPDDSDWGEWVAEADMTERYDLYLFAYGHDYKDAVSDFTRIAGKIPLPPKYALGYWWSRYWQYSDYEFAELAETMRSMNIPIDIMVIDMDWHETWGLTEKGKRDENGQRIGWTGYTWQKQLFPSPENFLESIHRLGIKTSLNLHPASGIQPFEAPYEAFVKDYMGRTDSYDGPEGYTLEDGTKAPVQFRIEDRHWADAYFNSVIHPIEKMGVDFWWLDWQQWKYSRYMPSLNNTFWLNYTFFNDKVRQSATQGSKAVRPMIYHRWGGLGSHRYQIGFSGDTYDEWKVLGYLPYFTSTASNVCYGYWGHDIGGHMQKKEHPTDPELYTRWLQFGVFTPIFKTHSTKTRFLERRFWAFPEHFGAMRDAVRLRYTLSPYIYTAARTAYDTGISMCRPMYYDYPEDEAAYTEKKQYMFGDDILAIAVDTPADSITGLSEVGVWFPKGTDWYDMATGAMYKGGEKRRLEYTVNENPYFVKAGAIIPMASRKISSLQEQDDEIYFFIAPGEGTSSTTLYEDDGISQEYPENFATTDICKSSGSGNTRVTVSPRKGTFDGACETRKIRIVLESILPPVSVKVNGNEIPYARFAGDGQWSYDGMTLSATVYVPAASVHEETTVECVYDNSFPSEKIYGRKGLLKRMAAITPEVKYVFGDYVDRLQMLPEAFLRVAQCSSLITENPSEAARYLEETDTEAMNSVFLQYEKIPENFKVRLKAQSAVIR